MSDISFSDLLKYGEADWLDWKRELHHALEYRKSQHTDWEAGKGTLLKDLASLANSMSVNDKRYLIRGVQDHGYKREIIGVSKRFDDADFQTWVKNAFDPPLKIHYETIEPEPGKLVGVFAIEFDPRGPHVAVQSVGGKLFEGQVWLRRGTQNDFAHREDLEALLVTAPCRFQQFSRGAEKILTAHYTPRELSLPNFGEHHEMLLNGYELAYWPGIRREIHIEPSNYPYPVQILMVKR